MTERTLIDSEDTLLKVPTTSLEVKEDGDIIELTEEPIQTVPENTPQNTELFNIVSIESNTEEPISLVPLPTDRVFLNSIPSNISVVDRVNVVNPIGIDKDLFTNAESLIKDLDTLKVELSNLVIRFDTDPQNYTKADTFLLLKVITNSLLHVYTRVTIDIINQWHETPSEDSVPSEALVKGDLDKITTSILEILEKIKELENKKLEWGAISGDINKQLDLIEILNDINKRIEDSSTAVSTRGENLAAFANNTRYFANTYISTTLMNILKVGTTITYKDLFMPYYNYKTDTLGESNSIRFSAGYRIVMDMTNFYDTALITSVHIMDSEEIVYLNYRDDSYRITLGITVDNTNTLDSFVSETVTSVEKLPDTEVALADIKKILQMHSLAISKSLIEANTYDYSENLSKVLQVGTTISQNEFSMTSLLIQIKQGNVFEAPGYRIKMTPNARSTSEFSIISKVYDKGDLRVWELVYKDVKYEIQFSWNYENGQRVSRTVQSVEIIPEFNKDVLNLIYAGL